MRNITLLKMPGGRSIISVSDTATVAEVAAEHDLFDRDFMLDGIQVKRSEWSTTLVSNSAEVAAVRASKGA